MTKGLIGEVVQSVKNPVVKARVFAIKYLYIKGEEGGGIRSRAGQKAEQQVVNKGTECKSSCQGYKIHWHLGFLFLNGAHVRASVYHGTEVEPTGMRGYHGVKE